MEAVRCSEGQGKNQTGVAAFRLGSHDRGHHVRRCVASKNSIKGYYRQGFEAGQESQGSPHDPWTKKTRVRG